MNFTWNGKQITNIGELGEAAQSCRLFSEADSLLREYAKHISHDDPDEQLKIAKSNIGYLAGYYGEETRTRIYELFCTEHPIFGNKSPAPADAFKAGQIWAEKGASAAKDFIKKC